MLRLFAHGSKQTARHQIGCVHPLESSLASKSEQKDGRVGLGLGISQRPVQIANLPGTTRTLLFHAEQ